MFRKLLSLDEAKEKISRRFKPKPLGVEQIPLLEANRRVLAEQVVSPIDVPPFNRSTVDGYAVKAEDTFGADEANPARLRLRGAINVGELPNIKLEKGETAEIATGAPLPKGADAVVMMENTEKRGGTVLVYRSVVENENVMKAGADIKKDEVVFTPGKRLTWKDIGVIAALGVKTVKVYRKPRVAVISTGTEIVAPGNRLPPGKIYDINGYTLSASVAECGATPLNMGVVPDDYQQLSETLREALETTDAVITSGGVSVGPRDFIPRILESLGGHELVVHGIAIKPGKPTTVALINGKPVFALPGHPTSALLTFHLLVRPFLAKLSGISGVEKTFKTVKACVGVRMFPAKGRRTFVTVKLVREADGRNVAYPATTGESGAITTLAKADGFIEIPENQQFIDAGEEATVHLFEV